MARRRVVLGRSARRDARSTGRSTRHLRLHHICLSAAHRVALVRSRPTSGVSRATTRRATRARPESTRTDAGATPGGTSDSSGASGTSGSTRARSAQNIGRERRRAMSTQKLPHEKIARARHAKTSARNRPLQNVGPRTSRLAARRTHPTERHMAASSRERRSRGPFAAASAPGATIGAAANARQSPGDLPTSAAPGLTQKRWRPPAGATSTPRMVEGDGV